ncbi:MAG TPA: DNA/RNA non-specific endonuclease [Candidatus Lumbricidophila sp.]|nr:DNA/RNA non-specific endonuclease [Candidatus Lumbricidophila sp.]
MTRLTGRIATSTIAAAVLVGTLSGCQLVTDQLRQITSNTATQAPEPKGVVSDSQPAAATGTGDYFSVVGTAQRAYPATKGQIGYCPLDSLHRPVCAYGELTDRPHDGQREPITINPPGWAHNTSVTIPALPGVSDSKSYKGYFWNRSHLLADSLGGAASAQNLVTGTRTQNVGSTQRSGQYDGGMAHGELLARQYLDSGAGATCPLYYAATPVYTGTELIPRTIIVDIQSCDKKLDERIEVSNTASGFDIDYRTGAFAAKK